MLHALGTPIGGALAPFGYYPRMLLALLPPGRALRLFLGGFLFKVLESCGDELVRVEARASDLLVESDPTAAIELLPEYERELALAAVGTNAERQARIVARFVARQRYRPVDFRTALAPLLGQVAANVEIIERTRADAIAMADDREIYRFFIYRNPTLPGAYFVASAQALVDKIKPSHTAGYVIESVNLLCDSPTDLCDRDVLGI